MLRLHSLVAAAVLAGLAVVPAGAASITETFIFNARVFGGPYDPVSGSATVTFDPAVSQAVTPLPSFLSNVPADEPFFFIYDASTHNLEFGDNCVQNSCSVESGTNQFEIGFAVDAAGVPNPASGGLAYSTVSDTHFFSSRSMTVFLGTGTAVPEPASFALLATALLGLIFAVRRQA